MKILFQKIFQKNVGIIGLGRIEKMVKTILNSFKAKVKTYDIGDNKKIYSISLKTQILFPYILIVTQKF